MKNEAYGSRGREILNRFFNGDQGKLSIRLSPGTDLFTDWRYILAADVWGGFLWVSRDTGEEIPVRVRDEKGEFSTEPVDAVMDPYDIPEGIRISVCKAQRSEPVPHYEPPGQIMYSEGSYRTWYCPDPAWMTSTEPFAGGVVHAVSDDGFTWQNGQECTFDWSDCPDVEARGGVPGIFMDPTCEKAERFKMVFQGSSVRPESAEHRRKVLGEFMEKHEAGIDPTGLSFKDGEVPVIRLARYGAVSPDGFQWKVLRLPLMIIHSDGQNVVYYDTNRESYIWFLKTQWYDGRRSIGRSETTDFRNWPLAETVIHPGPDLHPSDDLYTNSKTLYPGTRDHHYLFPGLYHHADDSSEICAYAGVDTMSWTRIPGGSILEPAEPWSWDAGFKTAGVDLVPLRGDKVALPYHGSRFPHKYPRNRNTLEQMKKAYALWPGERISSLIADESGRFATLPLKFDGRRLRLNFRTRQGGEIRVEAAESRPYGGAARPLPCRSFADCLPLVGDEMDGIVAWKSGDDLGHRDGQAVTLRFRMRAASLFAFEIR